MNTKLRLLIPTLLSALLAMGCASQRPAPVRNQISIAKVQKVEIFYSNEEHAIVHDLGRTTREQMVNLGGLFGPVGSLVAIGASYVASVDSMDQSAERSREFNTAMLGHAQSNDMNREVAQRMAQELERRGTTVKLTQVARLPGARLGETPPPPAPVDAYTQVYAGGPMGSAGSAYPGGVPDPTRQKRLPPIAGNGYQPTPGFTPLLLRVTTGYGAAEIYEEYRPIALIQYALIDQVDAKYLTHGTIHVPDDKGARGYQTWDELKADAKQARAQLEVRLLGSVPRVLDAALASDQ